jgi:hypothetical protein
LLIGQQTLKSVALNLWKARKGLQQGGEPGESRVIHHLMMYEQSDAVGVGDLLYECVGEFIEWSQGRAAAPGVQIKRDWQLRQATGRQRRMSCVA